MGFFTVKNQPFIILAAATLVVVCLFWLLGILGLKQLHDSSLSRALYEKIPFTIELKQDTKESEGLALQQLVSASDYVKAGSVQFIGKNEAYKQLKRDLGINNLDSMDILLVNPLPDVIQFKLKFDYYHQQKQFREMLLQNNIVQTVWSSEEMNPTVRQEIGKAASWFLPNKLAWWLLLLLVYTAANIIYLLGLLYLFGLDKKILQTYCVYKAEHIYLYRKYQNLLLKISGLGLLLLLLLIMSSQMLQSEPFFEINQPYSYAVLYLFLLLGLPLSAYLSLKTAVYLQLNIK
jgi:FtsX extracellular domain